MTNKEYAASSLLATFVGALCAALLPRRVR